MMSVDFSVDRRMADVEGQTKATTPARPGVLSYRNRLRAPNATAASQTIPSRAVTKIFLRMELRSRAELRPVTKQPPFHMADGLPAPNYVFEVRTAYEPISRNTPSSFWNSTGLVRW